MPNDIVPVAGEAMPANLWLAKSMWSDLEEGEALS